MCRPKHVEQLRNTIIINSTTRLHLVGSFYEILLDVILSFTFSLLSGLFPTGSSVKSVVCKCYTVCATYVSSSLPTPPCCSHFDDKILLSMLCSFFFAGYTNNENTWVQERK